MERDLIELNRLWEPIRPYLAEQVREVYGRQDGSVLEIGPFSGLAVTLAAMRIGREFLVAAFPRATAAACRDEARAAGLEGGVRVIESDEDLSGVPDHAFDLVIFRGALFFPSFFRCDLRRVYDRLRNGGVAMVGGGFGAYTPEGVIDAVKERSKELNAVLGRVRVTEEDVLRELRAAGLDEKAEIVDRGGLWVILRSP
jgi:SAM-dependent methyltransferase